MADINFSSLESGNEQIERALKPGTAHEAPNMPLPTDIRAVFLAGIFLILLLTALYFAATIVIPIVLAFILKLVLQPSLRALNRWHLPHAFSAALILLALVFGIITLGSILSRPAEEWAAKIPESVPHLQERLNFLTKPMEQTEKILIQADNLTKGAETKVVSVAMQGTRFSDRIFSGTQALISGFFTTMLILFFLLASGDTFLRRLVEILPRFQDKRQAVDISQQIEHDISSYLLTITAMNACVGFAAGIAMHLCGVGDAILWGTFAFLLNYIPILGAIIGIIVFLLAGMLVVSSFWLAVLPAMLYGAIHLFESVIITPMLLSRRFTLNPVLVILALVFWYWMWGIVGAILAMPMLAITKIICDRIDRLSAFGHFLEG